MSASGQEKTFLASLNLVRLLSKKQTYLRDSWNFGY